MRLKGKSLAALGLSGIALPAPTPSDSTQHNGGGGAQQRATPPPHQQEPAGVGPTGRPVRKRKATTFGEDMVSTDAAMKRGKSAAPTTAAAPAPAASAPPEAWRTQSAAAPTPQKAAPKPAPAANGVRSPPNAQALAAAAAAAAAKGQPGQRLVNPGPRSSASDPAHNASVVALTQLLKSPRLPAAGRVQHAQQALQPVLPYRLVAPAGAAAGSSGSAAGGSAVQQGQAAVAAVPVVQVGAPRDIARLAKQLDEQERKKAMAAAAAAAADARVALRVLPGNQTGQSAGRGKAKPGAAAAAGAGRGRAGTRQPKRPTPEPAERRADLAPGSWQPGVESKDGLRDVKREERSTASPSPAVQQPQYASSSDPLKASLEFLHYAARSAGRPPPQYSPAVAAAASAEQRQYLERLARAHFARDGREIAAEFLGPAPTAVPVLVATRKSSRMRSAPNIYIGEDIPLAAEQRAQQAQQAQRGAAPAKKQQQRRTPSPEEESDVRQGAEYQAVLPALRPRPAAPAANEARWTAGLVLDGAKAPAPPLQDVQQAAGMAAASREERAAWVCACHQQLRGALGDEQAAALGLLRMGADECARLLSDVEEAGLAAGMREFGHDFHSIRREHVPSRTVFELQDYYYNVWKLRTTPRSRTWYEEKAAHKAEQLAELERQEAAAVAQQEAQRLRLEAKYKRRMLREVVQWVKGAARAPTEAGNRPVVQQRAQRAAKLIGSMNAGGGEAAAEGVKAAA